MMRRLLPLVLCLMFLLCACGGEITNPTTESTNNQTIETTVDMQTESIDPSITDASTAPTETPFSLSDMDLSKETNSGISPYPLYPFIYNPAQSYLYLGEGNAEAITEAELEEGWLYELNEETGEIHQVLNEPVLAFDAITDYIFCITANNTLVITDHAGELYYVLYEAEEQLQPQSLNYWKKTLIFIDGAKIIKIDIPAETMLVLFEYEGAIDADLLYGIDEEFPHLMCVKTAMSEVACNLETGETAIIPEDGDNGTAAFELFMSFGIWPGETEPATAATQP